MQNSLLSRGYFHSSAFDEKEYTQSRESSAQKRRSAAPMVCKETKEDAVKTISIIEPATNGVSIIFRNPLSKLRPTVGTRGLLSLSRNYPA